MSEFYNCNFKVGDIIIGVNPESKSCYLKIFKIKDFATHDDFGRKIVDFAIVEHTTEHNLCTDIHTTKIGVKILNSNFKRIVVEEV